MKALWAIGLLALAGCDSGKMITVLENGQPVTIQSSDALDFAVLDNLQGKLLLDTNHHLSSDDLDCETVKIQKMRAWAKTVADPDVRAAYMRWIDFAATRVAESRKPAGLDPGEERARKVDAAIHAGNAMAPTLAQPPTDLQCEPST